MVSTAEQSRVWRAKTKLVDPGYTTRASQRWASKNTVRYLWNKARNNAQRAGLEFNITEEDIKIPAICPVLEIPLRVYKEGFDNWNNSPSIDRFDNTIGYVKGNVQVISWRANHLKSNGTLEEFRSLVRWLENGKMVKIT